MGEDSDFDFTILPVTVSFYNVNFRENIPGDAWVWPDTSAGNRPAAIVPYTVPQNNSGTDSLVNCVSPIGVLDPPPPGGALMAFTYVVRVPSEYQNQAGNWIVFIAGETHPRDYNAAGQCRARAVGTNAAVGGFMGPWQ